jgi:hypothetical protein
VATAPGPPRWQQEWANDSDLKHVELLRSDRLSAGTKSTGVGIAFCKEPGQTGPHIIYAVAKQSPAEQSSQIFPGDLLHAVDSIPVYNLSPEEVTRLIVGAPRSPVVLRISSAHALTPSLIAGPAVNINPLLIPGPTLISGLSQRQESPTTAAFPPSADLQESSGVRARIAREHHLGLMPKTPPEPPPPPQPQQQPQKNAAFADGAGLLAPPSIDSNASDGGGGGGERGREWGSPNHRPDFHTRTPPPLPMGTPNSVRGLAENNFWKVSENNLSPLRPRPEESQSTVETVRTPVEAVRSPSESCLSESPSSGGRANPKSLQGIGREAQKKGTLAVSFSFAEDGEQLKIGSRSEQMKGGYQHVAAEVTDRHGGFVHISPRGIESRLNEPFRAAVDRPQSNNCEGGGVSEQPQGGAVKKLVEELSEALRQEKQKLTAVTAQLQIQAATIKALKSAQGNPKFEQPTNLRGTPPRPAPDASTPTTRTEAVLVAAAAVDAAALALQQQQQQQQQQQLKEQLFPVADRSAADKDITSGTSQRIHEAFLLLSSQDRNGEGGGSGSASFVFDDLPSRAAQVCGGQTQAKEEQAALLERIAELEAAYDVATTRARAQEDVANDRQQRLEEAETRIQELHSLFEQLEIGEATGRAVSAGGEDVDSRGEDVASQDPTAMMEEKKELEGEILVTRRIATFRAVRIAVLQQQQQQMQQQQQQQHLELQEQQRHHEQAMQRREQAQTLAMQSRQHEHQCQTEQHLEAERQLMHKLALARDAHKSISDLKEREHDRLHASLQMAASNIARLQTENRRLQRLLQNRFIDAEDVGKSPSSPDDDAPPANGRHHSAQTEKDRDRKRDRESSVQTNGSIPTRTSTTRTTSAHAASSLASRSASNETQIPGDHLQPPQGAKPRLHSRDSSSSTSTSFNKPRLSLGKEGVRTGMHGDVVLVGGGRQEDSRTGGMGGRAMDAAGGGGGGVRGEVQEAADERRGRDRDRDSVSRVAPEERDESESMHWSSTSSDDRLQDRLSERRAGKKKLKVLQRRLYTINILGH